MGKVRFQMFLEEDQKRTLETLQRETKVPLAQIIRDAIDRLISEHKRKKTLSSDATTDELLSVAGVCEGGPHDLANGHDKYLYRTKKK